MCIVAIDALDTCVFSKNPPSKAADATRNAFGILDPQGHVPVPSPRRGWARRREARWVGVPLRCAEQARGCVLIFPLPLSLYQGWWTGQKNTPDCFYFFCCVCLSVCILSNVCPLRLVLVRGLEVEPGDVKAGPRQRW